MYTARQFEILSLIRGGMTQAAVAAKLGLSPRTVEKHCQYIRRKAGVNYTALAGNVEAQARQPRSLRAYVYFARAANGLIKIGWCGDYKKRIASMNTGSPVQIDLIGAVVRDNAGAYERELHEAFASARRRLEWFEPTPDLLNCIERHRAEFV